MKPRINAKMQRCLDEMREVKGVKAIQLLENGTINCETFDGFEHRKVVDKVREVLEPFLDDWLYDSGDFN